MGSAFNGDERKSTNLRNFRLCVRGRHSATCMSIQRTNIEFDSLSAAFERMNTYAPHSESIHQ